MKANVILALTDKETTSKLYHVWQNPNIEINGDIGLSHTIIKKEVNNLMYRVCTFYSPQVVKKKHTYGGNVTEVVLYLLGYDTLLGDNNMLWSNNKEKFPIPTLKQTINFMPIFSDMLKEIHKPIEVPNNIIFENSKSYLIL